MYPYVELLPLRRKKNKALNLQYFEIETLLIFFCFTFKAVHLNETNCKLRRFRNWKPFNEQ